MGKPNQVNRFLWIGDHRALGFSPYGLVVSAAKEIHPFGGIKNLHLQIEDKPITWEDDLDWQDDLRAVGTIIAAAVEGKTDTLVVCHSGINRSALVCGIALRFLGYSSENAIKAIRRARPFTFENVDFERAVRNMELIENA